MVNKLQRKKKTKNEFCKRVVTRSAIWKLKVNSKMKVTRPHKAQAVSKLVYR